MQIPLSQAHKYLPTISRSKTYADEASGVLTATKDPSHGNKKMVSLAELERVYGKIKNPEDKQDNTETNGIDSNGHLFVQFLEERIQDLQTQLEKAEHRETQLIEERGELVDLLKAETAEKKEIRALMPPPAEDKTPEDMPKQRNGHRNWLQRLIGA